MFLMMFIEGIVPTRTVGTRIDPFLVIEMYPFTDFVIRSVKVTSRVLSCGVLGPADDLVVRS